jgi:hypothetical protein
MKHILDLLHPGYPVYGKIKILDYRETCRVWIIITALTPPSVDKVLDGQSQRECRDSI